MSLNVKPTPSERRVAAGPLLPVALGTTLVLVTYVTPLVTITLTAADLHAGTVARAWMLSSMSVGLAAALLVTGVLGDALGRRRVYAAGLVTLAVGAAGCAAAADPVLFVAARVVEGVGGGAVLACGLAVLAHGYPEPAARLRATSVWGASVGLGIGLGAVLAAALDVGTGWRETYAVTAAVSLVLIVPTLRGVSESAAVHPRRVDAPGLGLLAVGLTLLVSALTQGRNGIGASTVLLAVLAVAALAGFAVVETRVREPLVEPELIGHRGFRAAGLGSLTLGFGMIGMASFVPTVAQVGLGAGVWPAALLVLAWAATSFATSMSVRRLPFSLEGSRRLALLLVGVAAGQLLGLGLSTSSGWGRLVAPMMVAGVFTGLLNASLGREAVASVPTDRAAMGSGANNTARYLGAACGITLFVTVATHASGGIVAGWNHATIVSAALTLLGALAVAVSGGRRQDVQRQNG